MGDGMQRENGRHKADQYKAVHAQWMVPHHQVKEHNALTMKQIMSIMAERDAAIQERDLAFSREKVALAERDMAILQRDAAMSERNIAMVERDNALAALEYRENTMNGSKGSPCSPGSEIPSGAKHIFNTHHMHHQIHGGEIPCHTREMHISDAFPISAVPLEARKPRLVRQIKRETKSAPCKKVSKPPRKGRRRGEDLNKQVTVAKSCDWKSGGSIEDLNKQRKPDWKGQDLGLNQIAFDESTMPVPVCSCTGTLKQCYKWGNGGWQSACCTTTMSMYPLPQMPNKRHSRVGGRKMSGSAFTKLISRLAAEGHDLSAPLDLRDHWAKHGTNRYITIK